MHKLLKLFLSVIICEGVGILGSIFTIPSISTWYAFLHKPLFSPPNWIFGPVWTSLYFLMGVSLFLLLEQKKKLKKQKKTLLILFSVQLFLNFLWSVIFFGLHLPLYAFIEIMLLWMSIELLIVDFWKFSKPAALLLVPYICWVSFALMLNLFVVLLNP